MAKNDAPPTLAAPKTKTQKAEDVKAKLASLKAKADAEKPAARLTYGITTDGKFQFVKQDFKDATAAVNGALTVFKKHFGKGLREIIISLHK